MAEDTLTYEAIAKLALNLPSLDKIRLMQRLVLRLQYEVEPRTNRPGSSLYGDLAYLGPAPSAEEIDKARKEMWGGGSRDDRGR